MEIPKKKYFEILNSLMKTTMGTKREQREQHPTTAMRNSFLFSRCHLVRCRTYCLWVFVPLSVLATMYLRGVCQYAVVVQTGLVFTDSTVCYLGNIMLERDPFAILLNIVNKKDIEK